MCCIDRRISWRRRKAKSGKGESQSVWQAKHSMQKEATHHTQTAEGTTSTEMENLEYTDRRNLSWNLDSSFLSVNEQGNIIPKTPEAALIAAQSYLL
jgi:hypothetical protein